MRRRRGWVPRSGSPPPPGRGVRSRGRCLTVLASAVLWAVFAGSAAAQEGCEWLPPSGNLQGTGNLTRVQTPHLYCRDGVRIRADSTRFYENTNYYELYGHVLFENPERILRSGRAQYFRSTGRLQAQEDVRLTRKSDNALVTGENLVFEEAGRGRAQDHMTVTGGRPHAVLYVQRDTARPEAEGPDSLAPPPPAAGEAGEESGPPAPYEVDADRIELTGEERFDASGRVEITRDSLEGYGDRAVYEQTEGTLVLLGEARMVNGGYTLVGDTVEAIIPEEAIREVVARRRATLTGEDLDVRAPLIRMMMADGALERMVAVAPTDTAAPPEGPPTGPPGELPSGELGGAPPPPVTRAALLQAEHPARPVARARDFIIVADSIDVRLPGRVLERLIAVGEAHGESTARDSLDTEDLPEVARRDWIDGRTIEATFSRAETPDTPEAAADSSGSEYRLESLVASGSARSLYRMAPRDSAAAGPDTTAVGANPTAVAGADTAAAAVALVDTTAAAVAIVDTAAVADTAGLADTAAVAGAGAPMPALHYVMGDTITLRLQEGRIRQMEVVGQVRGVHWEPRARRAGGGAGGGAPGNGSAGVPESPRREEERR